jgi:hypothetical protein
MLPPIICTEEPNAGLDLHLGKSVLPDNDVRGNTILAVVQENDP